MNNRTLTFFIVLIFSLVLNNIYAQNPDNKQEYINKKTKGGIIAFGRTYYNLPENVTYRPILFQAFWHKPIYESKNIFNISVEIVPQINFVILDSKIDFEFGTNIFLNFGFQITKKSIISFIIGSGPHFISVETERQSNGFIFSDNFLLNYKKQVSENIEVGVFSGYRHMSNADLKLPNTGIDNILLGISIAKIY